LTLRWAVIIAREGFEPNNIELSEVREIADTDKGRGVLV
jgi:diphthamide biosynthesis methyltransferase